MSLKTMAKRTAALAAAMGSLLFNVTVFGDTNSFNPVYSGTLQYTSKNTMTVSSEDAVMDRIIYPVSADTNRLLTVDNADSFVFDKDRFVAYYDHQGKITLSDGTFVQNLQGPIYIQAEEVRLTFNLFGKVKDVTVVYNNREYTKV